MQIRHAAPIVALAALLMAMPVSAAEKVVTVQGSSFGPKAVTVALGDEVTWSNEDGFGHTSTRTGFPSWSVALGANDSGSRTFSQAGTYAYACAIHGFMTGTVKVPVKASPASGSPSTTFTIRVANQNAASGTTYLIQRKAPGGSYTTWKTTTAQTVTFKSSVKGTWRFRSQVKKTSSGKASGFSPAASVTIG